MFPPRVVGIIGSEGKMAQHVVAPLFRKAGYEIIGSDPKKPDGLTNEQVVERADVVYISILPICDVAPVIAKLAPLARPDTLWLHGTSIQNPVNASVAEMLRQTENLFPKTTTGFLHFMVGPRVRSLRGQSAIYGFTDTAKDARWAEWLVAILEKEKLKLFKRTPEEHDSLTRKSQVIPMIVSLLTGSLWKMHGQELKEALQVAGPPCWLQTYGVLRNLSQSGVVAEILANHPDTGRVIADAKNILETLGELYGGHNTAKLEKIAQASSGVLPSAELERIKESTDWHVRLEGDLRGGAVCFRFSPQENKLGLLTEILRVFDDHGLSKTSCMAQEEPDGGCRFYIGLKEPDSPDIRSACDKVIAMLGGKIVQTAPL